jgi:hypothetical protein
MISYLWRNVCSLKHPGLRVSTRCCADWHLVHLGTLFRPSWKRDSEAQLALRILHNMGRVMNFLG